MTPKTHLNKLSKTLKNETPTWSPDPSFRVGDPAKCGLECRTTNYPNYKHGKIDKVLEVSKKKTELQTRLASPKLNKKNPETKQ